MNTKSLLARSLATTGLILSLAENAFARAGGGDVFVSSSAGGGGFSSGGSFGIGGLVAGGGGIGGLIFIIVLFIVGRIVLQKIGVLGNNAERNIMGANPANQPNSVNPMANPLNNAAVRNDLMRGNIEGAVIDGAIGAAVGSIFSNISRQVGVNIPGLNLGGMGGGAFAGADVSGGIARIKASDPGFNEQAFKDKAENAFFKIQEGWARQDTGIMRPFVSDSILARYATQLSDMKARGEKDVMENVVIGSMDLVDVKSDGAFDYITAKIAASAADYTVNSAGEMVRGSKTPTGFTEFWTFLRTSGAKTNVDKQLKDNKCPNCGAPLQVSATGACAYCGAIVSSGQFDWVLSEIRQNV